MGDSKAMFRRIRRLENTQQIILEGIREILLLWRASAPPLSYGASSGFVADRMKSRLDEIEREKEYEHTLFKWKNKKDN